MKKHFSLQAFTLLVAAAASAAAPKTLRDFGVTGDGTTDDTAALQRAVDSGQGEIRLERGRYRITRPIRIDLDRAGPVSVSGDGTATLIMAGPGPALHFVGTHRGTAAPESVTDNVAHRQRAPMLDGFEIVGEHPQSGGVRLEGTIHAILRRLLIRQTLDGIVLTGLNRNVIISDCHVYDNRGVGILLDRVSLHQINISACHVSYNRGGGIVVRASEVRNLQIGTSDIEANMGAKGPPAANILFDAREGSIREGAIIGCTLQHSHEAAGSANIRMLGRAGEPHKVGYFSISGNALSDAAVNIELKYARGVAITGNTVWEGYEHNLLVEGSSNVVVGPNVLDLNPDYKPGTSPDDLLFVDSSDCTLEGLHINATGHASEAPLTLRRCRRFHLNGITLLNAGATGLLLDDVEGVRVFGCLIRHGQPGLKDPVSLRITRGRDNTVSGNSFGGRTEVAPGSARVSGNR